MFRSKNGKALCYSVSSDAENRPELVCDRLTDYDFLAAKLIQIFEYNLVCVAFDGGKSHLTVFRLEQSATIYFIRFFQLKRIISLILFCRKPLMQFAISFLKILLIPQRSLL